MTNYSKLVGIENQYRQDYTALAVHVSGTTSLTFQDLETCK